MSAELRQYEGRASLPEGMAPGRYGRCFEDCQRLILDRRWPTLRYVEGVVITRQGGSFDVAAHGFLVDDRDRVIEPTLPDGFERRYFGHAFTPAEVRRATAGRPSMAPVDPAFLDRIRPSVVLDPEAPAFTRAVLGALAGKQ